MSSSTAEEEKRSLEMGYVQKHTNIKDLLNSAAVFAAYKQPIQVCGWVRSVRVLKSVVFLVVEDRMSAQPLQVVLQRALFDTVDGLANGVAVSVSGKLVICQPKDKLQQSVEMEAQTIRVFAKHGDPEAYPIAKSQLGKEFLREIPHLRLRTQTTQCVMRIRSTIHQAVHAYYGGKLGFQFTDMPYLTASECEGGSFPFRVTTLLPSTNQKRDIPSVELKAKSIVEKEAPSVDIIDNSKDFFRKPVYLTVSAQLHLECVLNAAYTLTRAFRAEPSDTYKHVAEITMLETEAPFIDLKDNIDMTESFIKFAIGQVLVKNKDDIQRLQESLYNDFCVKHHDEVTRRLKAQERIATGKKPGSIDAKTVQVELKLMWDEQVKKNGTLEQRLCLMSQQPFVRTTHQEMILRMQADVKEGKVKFEKEPALDADLASEHERYIVNMVFPDRAVVVRYFPKAVKSFYMPVIDEGAEVEHVDGYDILMPHIGEVVGGSQREWNYGKMMKRLDELKMDKDVLEFYTDLRAFGSAPHGGCGIGIDRLVMFCTGQDNIRDVIAFPRVYRQCLC